MFHKATASGPAGNCVEVEVSAGGVFVRDSKENGSQNAQLLAFTHDEWRAFLDGCAKGEFNIPDFHAKGYVMGWDNTEKEQSA